ncbi:MAG: transketolase [Fimbriimonadales bacterium]
MEEARTAGNETGIVEKTLNTIRGLSMDAVQAAKSGHPGLPMGAAAMGYALFAKHLRFDPQAPKWHNRDRFILSAGHGSMLLYSLLHLTGYDLSLEDLKNFRQWESKTPGHPENFMTPGVEMATGPLGQGFATGVGMAIAEERARALYPQHFDHWTYAIVSDGDLMEGLSHEAASLAGHLRLGRMIYLYDSNRITIDGSTDLSFSEDVRKRFEAYGWRTEECDGMSVGDVDQKIAVAKADDRPSLIVCRTTIGYGSPNKADSSASHGSPLGEDEVVLAKRELGIPVEPLYLVPDEVREHMLEIGARSRQERESSEAAYAGSAAEKALTAQPTWDAMPAFEKPEATRASSGKVINTIAPAMPGLVGGSADLTESNQTEITGSEPFSVVDRDGRNIHFGVREHAMAAALNGITLHGTGRAFGGTFLIFSDYMKPAIRLSALMRIGTVFVFTHDSIGLGEDGPTHQPIEQLAGLRAIPNLHVYRPADGNETVCAWKAALQRIDGPTALVLTRQSVTQFSSNDDSALKGAYVAMDADDPKVVLIGTGSEVEICMDAARLLASDGVAARVVSMPCWEAFAEQPHEYRDSVLPPGVPRISIEAAATLGWERWIGDGRAIGLDHFGASAPYKEIYEHFGLTASRVCTEAKALL